ncbi:MAG: alkaline phosphatase family protein [Acidobacteria bacterium]|nr:alkaline phosphatase family protein [Acidobacteriota bacterium]
MANKKDDKNELRDLLKSAGYLDNRLEGFFLRSVRAKGSALVSYILTSLKIGVILGLLVAVIFTIAVIQFNPGIVKNLKDVLLLTFYLWLFLSIILSIIALLLGGIIALLQRLVSGGAKKINVSLITANLVGIAVFAYLSVWWIAAATNKASSGSGFRDLLAFIVIFILSFGVARLVFFGGVALMARTQVDLKIGKLVKFRRKHILIAGAVSIILFSLLFYVAGTKITKPMERESVDYNTIFTDNRIVLVAIDGMDKNLALRMMDEGKLPTLKKLLVSGTAGEFKTDGRHVPPVFWTTIATGMNPVEHGISDIRAHRLSGVDTPLQSAFGESAFAQIFKTLIPTKRLTSDVPITANLRRSKTFWNILNDKTFSVGIINWWVSWPCDEVKGFISSERLLYKLETGGEWERDIEPKEVFDELKSEVTEWRKEFDLFFTNKFDEYLKNLERQEEMKIIREAGWIDYFNIRLDEKLYKKNRVKLSAVYLPGADIIQNRLLADLPVGDVGELSARIDIIKTYYMALDEQLTKVIFSQAKGTYNFALVSPGRYVEGNVKLTGEQEGFFILAGPGVDVGNHNLVINTVDVTPTILFLLGFPQSDDFKGKPITGLLTKSNAAELTTEKILTFGDRKADEDQSESKFSREVLEQLRNLGYIN